MQRLLSLVALSTLDLDGGVPGAQTWWEAPMCGYRIFR